MASFLLVGFWARFFHLLAFARVSLARRARRGLAAHRASADGRRREREALHQALGVFEVRLDGRTDLVEHLPRVARRGLLRLLDELEHDGMVVDLRGDVSG